MNKEEKLILSKNSELEAFKGIPNIDSKKCYTKPELTILGNLVSTTLGGSGTNSDMLNVTNTEP